MTARQTAVAAAADLKWLTNSAALLHHRLRYSGDAARWWGLVRVLVDELGLTLKAAADAATAALATGRSSAAPARTTATGAARIEVDLPRYESIFLANLSRALNQVNTARYKGVCQVEGTFLVLDAGVFLSIIDSLGDLKRRLLRYSQFAGEVVAQTAACNSVHTVEQRCARWLLITADATGNKEFHITQEFLSQMLAVRRPGVTVAMGGLVKAGLVSGRYGHVKLLDTEGLKNVACECYQAVRLKAEELLS
jgi:CRP-like cAMP-binding protein